MVEEKSKRTGLALASITCLSFFGLWAVMAWAIGTYIYDKTDKTAVDALISGGIFVAVSILATMIVLLIYRHIAQRYNIPM